MPRPERLEYEGAFYHVMNRGRGRETVFHDDAYYECFLQTLKEAHQRFDIRIHGYCLMSNHYHLIIETPHANLVRVMRHINGVYTQRHNRLKKTDGPLFRGRYKSIIVDADSYLLPLSRYVHRNPIETQKPLVDSLADYPWSSYPAYINKAKVPDWLFRDMTYGMLGSKQRYHGYKAYVLSGVDEDIKRFYNQGNQANILSGSDFRQWLYEEKYPDYRAEKKRAILRDKVSIATITTLVAAYYKVTDACIRAVVKGPVKGLEARKVAMYCCQELGDHRLSDIAEHFQLSHPGSVSYITHQVRQKISEDRGLAKKVEKIVVYVVKQAI